MVSMSRPSNLLNFAVVLLVAPWLLVTTEAFGVYPNPSVTTSKCQGLQPSILLLLMTPNKIDGNGADRLSSLPTKKLTKTNAKTNTKLSAKKGKNGALEEKGEKKKNDDQFKTGVTYIFVALLAFEFVVLPYLKPVILAARDGNI